MEPKYATVLLIGVAVGCFFLNRFLIRRANIKYQRDLDAMNARIRAKQAARDLAAK